MPSTLRATQVQTFINSFQGHAAGAIRELNNLQEILAFGQANGMLTEGGMTPQDLAGTSLEDLDIALLMAAITSVGGVVLYLQQQGVYGDVAPILSTPAL